jgi:hypothetical protein
MRREYKGAAPESSLAVALDDNPSTDLTIYCNNLSNWPTGVDGRPFYVVIDRGKANEEKILCASRSSNTLSVWTDGITTGRGQDDTTTSFHNANAKIEHVFTATDADEANAHVNTSLNVHGIADTSDLVLDSDPRLTNERVPTNNSVSAAKIQTDAVTTVKIQNSAVTTAKIADDAITSDKIALSAVGTTEIAPAAVTASRIATGGVNTSNINDLAVTEGKIASNAVTSAKIQTGAVTTTKIGTGAVTETNIASGTITSANIQNGTIVNDDISATAAIAQSKVSGLTSDLGLRYSSPTAGVNVIASGSFSATVGVASYNSSVSFTGTPFGGNTPRVVVSASDPKLICGAANVTPTGFVFSVLHYTGSAPSPAIVATFYWIAIRGG